MFYDLFDHLGHHSTDCSHTMINYVQKLMLKKMLKEKFLTDLKRQSK